MADVASYYSTVKRRRVFERTRSLKDFVEVLQAFLLTDVNFSRPLFKIIAREIEVMHLLTREEEDATTVESAFLHILEAMESSGDPYEGTPRLMCAEDLAETVWRRARMLLGRRHAITYKIWLMRIFLSSDPYTRIMDALDSCDRDELAGDLLAAFNPPVVPVTGVGTFMDSRLTDDPIREARYFQTLAAVFLLDGRLESAGIFARGSLEMLDKLRDNPESLFWHRRDSFAEVELGFCRRRAVVTLLEVELAGRTLGHELRAWKVLAESLIYDARHARVLRHPRSYRKMLDGRELPRNEALRIKSILGKRFPLHYLEIAVAGVRVRAASAIALEERPIAVLELREMAYYLRNRIWKLASVRERQLEATVRRCYCLVRRSMWDYGCTLLEGVSEFTSVQWRDSRSLAVTTHFLSSILNLPDVRLARQDLLAVCNSVVKEVSGRWLSANVTEEEENLVAKALQMLRKLLPFDDSPVEFARSGTASNLLELRGNRHLRWNDVAGYLELSLHSRLLALSWRTTTTELVPSNLRNLLRSLSEHALVLEKSAPTWRWRAGFRTASESLTVLFHCLTGAMPMNSRTGSLQELVERSIRRNLDTHVSRVRRIVASREMKAVLDSYMLLLTDE